MVREWSVFAILFVSALSLGCAPPAQQNKGELGMKGIGILYLRFVGSHGGQAPANREEFDQYLATLSEADLKAVGLDKLQDAFVSNRDKSEIVVRYGITIPPPQPGNPTVVVYEARGIGGRRMVVYGTAGVDEITNERLKELVPDAK